MRALGSSIHRRSFLTPSPSRKGLSPFYPLAASQPVHGRTRQYARHTTAERTVLSTFSFPAFSKGRLSQERGSDTFEKIGSNEEDCIVSWRTLITCVTKASMHLMTYIASSICNPICNFGLTRYKRLLSIRFSGTVFSMYYFYTYSCIILHTYLPIYFLYFSYQVRVYLLDKNSFSLRERKSLLRKLPRKLLRRNDNADERANKMREN